MDSGGLEDDRRMFRYHQYCPVARACEILADRWMLLIVRELLFGSRRFNDLRRGLPRISRSLLVARLRHLEDNGVIERYMGARPNVTEYVDRKSTRLNSSHPSISYAVFCLKKKKRKTNRITIKPQTNM